KSESERTPGAGSRSPAARALDKKSKLGRGEGVVRAEGHRSRYFGKSSSALRQRFLEQSRISLEERVCIRKRGQSRFRCGTEGLLHHGDRRPGSALRHGFISPKRAGHR